MATPRTYGAAGKTRPKKAALPTRRGVQISAATRKYELNVQKRVRRIPAARYVGRRSPGVKRLRRTTAAPRSAIQRAAASSLPAGAKRRARGAPARPAK